MNEYKIHILYQTIFETLSKSTKTDLINFFKKNASIKNYLLISDYCIGDENKFNDVYSFTIIPNVSLFEAYIQIIKKLLPKDYKKIGFLSKENIKVLEDLPYLSINFIIPREFRDILKTKNNKEELEKIINSAIDMFNLWIQDNPDNKDTYEEHIKQYRLLLQKSKSKDFKINLYLRSFFTATLAAYITHLIEKYSNATGIVWGSDRDSMFSYINEIIIDNYSIQHNAFARNDKDWTYSETKVGYMRPDTEEANWYDELIRIPDYCAGALASVSFSKENTYNISTTEKQMNKAFSVLHAIKNNCINIVIKKKTLDNNKTTIEAARLVYSTEKIEVTK